MKNLGLRNFLLRIYQNTLKTVCSRSRLQKKYISWTVATCNGINKTKNWFTKFQWATTYKKDGYLTWKWDAEELTQIPLSRIRPCQWKYPATICHPMLNGYRYSDMSPTPSAPSTAKRRTAIVFSHGRNDLHWLRVLIIFLPICKPCILKMSHCPATTWWHSNWYSQSELALNLGNSTTPPTRTL